MNEVGLGSVRGRRWIVLVATTAVFVALVGRLWFLQVVSSSKFEDQAAGNRTRLVQIEGPRGRIFDAAGRPLADRRVALAVALDWQHLADIGAGRRAVVFDRLEQELAAAGHEFGTDAMQERYEQALDQSLQPEILVHDIEPRLWISLAERDLAGVVISETWLRTYPNGEVASHVLGHLGQVADWDEARSLNLAISSNAKPYEAGDLIGRNGLEARFEAQLRGTPEIRRVEIDAHNRQVGTAEVVQEARPGLDLYLSIDLELQIAAEDIVASELMAARSPPSPAAAIGCQGCDAPANPAGSLVALRPDDGAIVALVSDPGFDPSWFVDGLSETQAADLFGSPERPLFNRATSGRYPIGSTFKPITAYAALTSGARTESDVWLDQGRYRLADCRSPSDGCVFQNAGGIALGPVDLRSALARSSDTYFYSLGETFWVERDRFGPEILQNTAKRFGLGSPTGIDLPSEVAGVVPVPAGPSGEADGSWFTGDNVNLSIGQGRLLATPLQLANLYAALSTGGLRYRPRVADRLVDPESGEVVQRLGPTELGSLTPMSVAESEALAAIDDGLHDVTRSGTAGRAFAGFPLDRFPVAGKTGTAQVQGHADLSLFGAYGSDRIGGDRLAVAVVLEESGFGSEAAAPATRAFLDVAYGLPAADSE